jgi:hypothetical protein
MTHHVHNGTDLNQQYVPCALEQLDVPEGPCCLASVFSELVNSSLSIVYESPFIGFEVLCFNPRGIAVVIEYIVSQF